MKINEIKEMYSGRYEDIEVYKPNSNGEHYPACFHTDNCTFTEGYTDESEAGLYELMDEDDYAHSILANSSISADFSGWYGDADATVLCIMLI